MPVWYTFLIVIVPRAKSGFQSTYLGGPVNACASQQRGFRPIHPVTETPRCLAPLPSFCLIFPLLPYPRATVFIHEIVRLLKTSPRHHFCCLVWSAIHSYLSRESSCFFPGNSVSLSRISEPLGAWGQLEGDRSGWNTRGAQMQTDFC